MFSSIVYSAHGIHYSDVSGQISGYKFGTPDGFLPYIIGTLYFLLNLLIISTV